MSQYAAPLAHMQFVLDELAGFDAVHALAPYADASRELALAVLEEAARFAREVLDPLNAAGDRNGVKLADGRVITAPGFAAAYTAFAQSGWNGIAASPEFGGQGLPKVLALAVEEMWNSANLSFALAPMLTSGVIEALQRHGSAAQQAAYVSQLASGRWCGTMNLTEPQAGSDLSAVRTLATPDGDGKYRIRGTKIFITWGEHDLADNIVHLVLARTPGAPEGTRGISLFAVPKFVPDAEGRPGERNDIACVALESKLGIHASPTCVLSYGERGGAIGELVGELNRGLECMFTVMNHARLGVGLEGVAVAERAYQHALDYAKTRVQGREAGVRDGGRVAILRHGDVRRMLLSMKSRVEAMRALVYFIGSQCDMAHGHSDDSVRAECQALADLLTPVAKGWCTEQAVDIASLGVQVHGGMGYVEETGAAQYLRDARITTIYEGTTGIQANDLVGRKVLGDAGRAAFLLFDRMERDAHGYAGAAAEGQIPSSALAAIGALRSATGDLLRMPISSALSVAVPYLHLFGTAVGGWLMLRAACAGLKRGDDFGRARVATATFYAAHVLPQCNALARQVADGPDSILSFADDWW